MRRLVLVVSCVLLCFAGLCQAQQFTSVEEKMTGAEFKAAGLEKLSPEELAALNAWIQRQVAQQTARAAAASSSVESAGLRNSDYEGPVSAHIVGDFHGWEGGTTFNLDNGQVWQQDSVGELYGAKLSNPAVNITQGLFGHWYLQVEGYNSAIQVKRIK